MKATVDILLATYNGETFLEEQLHSLLQQQHESFHILIRDDLSSDRTPSILDGFAKRHPEQITLLQSSSRLGILGNFSTLLTQSTAPYTMLCDQDDIWLPKKVEQAVCAMQRAENMHGTKTPLLLHTDLKVVDRDLKEIHPSFWGFSKLYPEQNSTFNRLLLQNTVTGCATLLNRPLKELIREIPREAIMHDWWLAIVASAFGKVISHKEASILYRQHGSNTLGAKGMQFSNYFARALETFNTPGQHEKTLQQRFLQAKCFKLLYGDYLDSEKKEILNAYLEGHRASWISKRILLLRYGFYRNGTLRNLSRVFLNNPF